MAKQFYLYDVCKDETIATVGPILADSSEEADAQAFAEFCELWPDDAPHFEDWSDFAASCHATSVLHISAADALIRLGMMKLPEVTVEAARKIMDRQQTLTLMPVVGMAKIAHDALSNEEIAKLMNAPAGKMVVLPAEEPPAPSGK